VEPPLSPKDEKSLEQEMEETVQAIIADDLKKRVVIPEDALKKQEATR
jgi:hypothetical protein